MGIVEIILIILIISVLFGTRFYPLLGRLLRPVRNLLIRRVRWFSRTGSGIRDRAKEKVQQVDRQKIQRSMIRWGAGIILFGILVYFALMATFIGYTRR